MKEFKSILEENQPYVILLVGLPLSGKSTFYNEYLYNMNNVLISRDEIMLSEFGSRDYDLAYDVLGESKLIDKKLKSELLKLSKEKRNVVIDMTNLTIKGRWNHIAKFPKHFKCAVIFDELSDDEYIKRNHIRQKKEDKTITMEVINRMRESYVTVELDEGFDYIINSNDKEIK